MVEKRFARLNEVDKKCLSLTSELPSAQIDFTAPDPWDWWKRGVKLEGEEEVICNQTNEGRAKTFFSQNQKHVSVKGRRETQNAQ